MAGLTPQYDNDSSQPDADAIQEHVNNIFALTLNQIHLVTLSLENGTLEQFEAEGQIITDISEILPAIANLRFILEQGNKTLPEGQHIFIWETNNIRLAFDILGMHTFKKDAGILDASVLNLAYQVLALAHHENGELRAKLSPVFPDINWNNTPEEILDNLLYQARIGNSSFRMMLFTIIKHGWPGYPTPAQQVEALNRAVPPTQKKVPTIKPPVPEPLPKQENYMVKLNELHQLFLSYYDGAPAVENLQDKLQLLINIMTDVNLAIEIDLDRIPSSLRQEKIIKAALAIYHENGLGNEVFPNVEAFDRALVAASLQRLESRPLSKETRESLYNALNTISWGTANAQDILKIIIDRSFQYNAGIRNILLMIIQDNH